ncbi:DUF202 domain-containing protein [Dactylosporangium sp. NPDC000555]|uniref:DUF202 domain-containing protein n=1 Tax=Dactylosporangium sp. NPDC000555 TaxID=3154260 RepID=UPI003325FE25
MSEPQPPPDDRRKQPELPEHDHHDAPQQPSGDRPEQRELPEDNHHDAPQQPSGDRPEQREFPEDNHHSAPQQPSGAQLERTYLSWRRTLVSFTVMALLLARLAAVHLEPTMPAAWALAAVALGWAAAVWLTLRRIRDLTTPIGRTLPSLVALILVYCVMGTLLLMS